MSCSSLYCTLYSLKQNKNMSPRTYKFTMHAVTFLKGLRCRCSKGNHKVYVSPSAVTQKHSTFRCIRYDALLGSGLGFFFFFDLQQNSSQAVGEKWKVKSGLHELAACQDKHLVIQRWHLLARLRRNFLLDAAQNGKVAQNKKVNIWRGQPTVRLMLLPFLKCVKMHF